MRSATMFLLVSLLALVGPTGLFAQVELRERTGASGREFVLENNLIRTVIAPARGGRVVSLVDKRNGFELIPDGDSAGMLLDMFSSQHWPGEMQNAPYEAEIVAREPAAAAVRLSRRSYGRENVNIRGILVQKTVWLRQGEPFLDVRYTFFNKGDDYKSPQVWLQQFCQAGGQPDGDVFVRPGRTRVAHVNILDGETSPASVTDPSEGWTACIDPSADAGCVFLMDYNYLRWLYNSFMASTAEWFCDPVMLAPNEGWETRVIVAALNGFADLSHASAQLLAHTQVARQDDGVIVLEHSLAALEGGAVRGSLEAELVAPDTCKPFPRVASSVAVPIGRVTTIAQELPDPAVGEELLLNVTWSADGKSQTWSLALPDRAGATELVDALRVLPAKQKPSPKKPPRFRINKETAEKLLIFCGPGSAGYHSPRFIEAFGADNVKLSRFASQVIVDVREEFYEYFPPSYDVLKSYRGIIFAGTGPDVLEEHMKGMLKDYVQAGGTLMVLGGMTAMNGWSRDDTPLAEVMPLVNPGVFRIKRLEQVSPVVPLDKQLRDSLAWTDAPVVMYVHEEVIADGTRVIAKAGPMPVLIEREYGQGRVIVFLGTLLGQARQETPIWKWKDWPGLIKTLLNR